MTEVSVHSLAARLRNARTLTEHKQASSVLGGLLDTPLFCRKLTRLTEEGNGWSIMLKSVVIGLCKDKPRGERFEHVEPLHKLIAQAAKWEQKFDPQVVQKFIASALDEHLSSCRPSPVAALYWSMMNILCSSTEYFQLMGRLDAAKLAGRILSYCWNVLSPSPHTSEANEETEGANGRTGSAEQRRPIFAVWLLCAVLTHFPFALPKDSLRDSIDSFIPLASNGRDELRALTPQLWMAINVLLRRQATQASTLLICRPSIP